MTRTALTGRQQRELEYYEEYSRRNAPHEVRFDPVSDREHRPWNSYWAVIETAKQNFRSGDQLLLDFGCGPGEYSFLYSKIGYEVFGFDLSPNNISIAKGLAQKYGMEDRIHFSVGLAEELNYPSEYFDIIIGIDILHHVNIRQALAECSRVLKRGGIAIFHEPLRVPVFDTLRETRFGRWLVPKIASIERHTTHDERKLIPADIDLIRSLDPNASFQRFLLTSRLSKFIRIGNSSVPALLERMDYHLFKLLPFLNTYGGRIIVTLRK